MIVHHYRIPYTYGQTIKLKPLFDIHLGNRYCDERALKEDLSKIDESTYIIGGGDILDSIITKDIKRYTKHSDATESDAIIDEQIDKAYHYLQPFADRIIGLGLGNHESSIVKYHGTNPIKRLCDKLGSTYLGYSWLIKLQLHENGSRGRTVLVRGHHGYGGGSRTQGADLTKFAKDTAYWDADLFLYGHVHRKQSDEVPRMGIVGSKLVAKPKLIGICGTYLKTYSDTVDSTYSEEAGYPPVSIGGLTVSIKPRDQWVKMWFDG